MNKSTLGVNNVTTCLQRLVVYSPVSPIAARSHRIVCTRRKGSVLDVVCAHKGTAHSAWLLWKKWHVPAKNMGSSPVTREMSSRVRCYITLESILEGKNERVTSENKNSKIWPPAITD